LRWHTKKRSGTHVAGIKGGYGNWKRENFHQKICDPWCGIWFRRELWSFSNKNLLDKRKGSIEEMNWFNDSIIEQHKDELASPGERRVSRGKRTEKQEVRKVEKRCAGFLIRRNPHQEVAAESGIKSELSRESTPKGKRGFCKKKGGFLGGVMARILWGYLPKKRIGGNWGEHGTFGEQRPAGQREDNHSHFEMGGTIYSKPPRSLRG